MKAFSRLNHVVFAAVLAFVVVAGAQATFAVPANQVYRNLTTIILTGKCCPNVPGETVSVIEPTAVTPVVLTWHMEYVSSNDFAFGVSINGGACGDYGANYAPFIGGTSPWPHSFQWVIYPSDGLVTGKNTFTVCYGPVFNPTDTLNLGSRTLAVRITK